MKNHLKWKKNYDDRDNIYIWKKNICKFISILFPTELGLDLKTNKFKDKSYKWSRCNNS